MGGLSLDAAKNIFFNPSQQTNTHACPHPAKSWLCVPCTTIRLQLRGEEEEEEGVRLAIQVGQGGCHFVKETLSESLTSLTAAGGTVFVMENEDGKTREANSLMN